MVVVSIVLAAKRRQQSAISLCRALALFRSSFDMRQARKHRACQTVVLAAERSRKKRNETERTAEALRGKNIKERAVVRWSSSLSPSPTSRDGCLCSLSLRFRSLAVLSKSVPSWWTSVLRAPWRGLFFFFFFFPCKRKAQGREEKRKRKKKSQE